MQTDFHFYCIGVLAKAAGFSKDDALTIAYASQYVDDAIESEQIAVGDLFFDPVRTAHMGLRAFDWGIQKRVYIPFHFIPPSPIRSLQNSFVTAPDSAFALKVLEEACQEEHSSRCLCRIGIALHTLADTWAHRGFSGRQHGENDVESIHHYKKGKWKSLFLENIFLDVLPQIGHTEAGNYPDLPFLRWKYDRPFIKQVVERNNTNDFLAAAKAIHARLCTLGNPRPDALIEWKDMETILYQLLSEHEEDLEIRCAKWKDQFKSLFAPSEFEYSRLAWRNDALNPRDEKDTAWDDFRPSDFRQLHFPLTPGFYDSKWVQFHRAALRQRHIVLENLL